MIRPGSNFSNLVRDLAVEEVDVFGDVQLILATVTHQVRVENVVALDQQSNHVTGTDRREVWKIFIAIHGAPVDSAV